MIRSDSEQLSGLWVIGEEPSHRGRQLRWEHQLIPATSVAHQRTVGQLYSSAIRVAADEIRTRLP